MGAMVGNARANGSPSGRALLAPFLLKETSKSGTKASLLLGLWLQCFNRATWVPSENTL